MPTTEPNTVSLPLLPIEVGVVLPQMVVTLAPDTDEATQAIQAASSADGLLLLVPRTEGRYAKVGTVARVDEVGQLPNGQQAVLLRGLSRAVVGTGVAGSGPGLWVQAERIEDPTIATGRLAELTRELRGVVSALAERRRSRRLPEALASATEPGALADAVAGGWTDLPVARAVEVLETLDVEERVRKVLGWARDALAEHEVADQIRTDVAEGMERTQREFLLRQQLAAIRKELGELGDAEGPVAEYRAKVEAADLPADVRTAIEKEIDRLERTSEQNPEGGWIRTWLDTVLDVPWGVRSEDRLDVEEAREVLDADHTGLSDVKDRIIEYLAVRKLRTERGLSQDDRRGAGAIVALVGPPGVGKTSLGESVARAMGRKFVRVALGGVHDEAEIRGHRRTYVGAAAGRIVRAIREAGTMNPVLLLDEVDKLGADWRGDPSSALLEVLDPAQNHTFRDHYLEVDLDLSDVVFLATANVSETIPGALLDRMELVRLDGYTEDEKVAIGRDHLLARQLQRNGLVADDVTVTEDALRAIVSDYTREAGVRGLERELGKLLRKVATAIASDSPSTPVVVEGDDVATYLGRPRFFAEAAERTSVPGVATGLAVTGAGGDVLFIEASSMDGEGLVLTGQLGDVMKESAEIALSYVRSHADDLEVSTEAATKRRFHVHVPAGAVPKDGPSAGVTMTTALTSLLTGRAVRSTVGMTGEVTLQGKVLPIGGVKQKVLAAHRAGLTEVVLPARNGGDLDDVPEAVRQRLSFHLVDDVADVLAVALEPARAGEAAEVTPAA
ncbi:MAG: endopeptidase La [Actinobacteria bacterium]|nr:MAG: endopeptidase La [Actinomycetota bacterium]